MTSPTSAAGAQVSSKKIRRPRGMHKVPIQEWTRDGARKVGDMFVQVKKYPRSTTPPPKELADYKSWPLLPPSMSEVSSAEVATSSTVQVTPKPKTTLQGSSNPFAKSAQNSDHTPETLNKQFSRLLISQPVLAKRTLPVDNTATKIQIDGSREAKLRKHLVTPLNLNSEDVPMRFSPQP